MPDEATREAAKLLNSAIKHLKDRPLGLQFSSLLANSERLTIFGYSDAAFASNTDLSSQLDMVIVLCDEQNNASIIH